VDGQIGFYCWAAFGEAYNSVLRTRFALAPDCVYLYNLYTCPPFRQAGLAWTGLSQLLQRLARRGVRASVALVAVENRPARMLLSRVGSRHAAYVRCIQLLGRRRWTVTPVRDARVPFRLLTTPQQPTRLVQLDRRCRALLAGMVSWGVTLRSLVVLERPIDETIPDIRPGVPLEIEELSAAQIPALAKFRPHLSPAWIQRRLARGDRCLIATHLGSIVHCTWVAFRHPYNSYVRRTIQLRDRQVYSYNTFTDPGFRGRRIMQAVRSHEFRLLRAEGYETSVSVVIRSNRASLAALGALGCQVIGRIDYRCVLGRRRWKTTWGIPDKTRVGRPAAVILGLSVTGLNVLRGLGKRGIPVVGVDCDRTQIGWMSRYGKKALVPSPDEDPQAVVERLLALSRAWTTPPVLLPTTDRFARFVARYRDALAAGFRINVPDAHLADALIDLRGRFVSLLRPGAPIALTGILQSQAQTVIDAYAPSLRLHAGTPLEGWVLLTGGTAR